MTGNTKGKTHEQCRHRMRYQPHRSHCFQHKYLKHKFTTVYCILRQCRNTTMVMWGINYICKIPPAKFHCKRQMSGILKTISAYALMQLKKIVGLSPLFGEGAGSPSSTMWPGPRPTSMPSAIRPPTVKKTFLRTPKIFKFKDIIRTGLR